MIITRFSPAPTGDLHIGGARTALFNWLFARHHNGEFHLRIENTDLQRSKDEFTNSIIESLKWMELNWNHISYQNENLNEHVKIANMLLASGYAYRCYTSEEDLEKQREQSKKLGKVFIHDRKWRNVKEVQEGPYAVRFKMPLNQTLTINDVVQGKVSIQSDQLDDFVILRRNGSPTYLLSAVVDDMNAKVTHVIRGNDHLTNTFKQQEILKALNSNLPIYAHIPLIHNCEGAKLSKRHGALSVLEYKKQGILPMAFCNYLLRLGWSHGNDEIISREQAIKWFNLENIGKASARFDEEKLYSTNSIYMRSLTETELRDEVFTFAKNMKYNLINDETWSKISSILPSIAARTKTIKELSNDVYDFFGSELPKYNYDVVKPINTKVKNFLMKYVPIKGSKEEIELNLRNKLMNESLSLKDVALHIRLALTGRKVSPGLFDMMFVLSEYEYTSRIKAWLKKVS